MQLRIWARLAGVDCEQFTHPVSTVEEAKSLLSALPRFYDWCVDSDEDDPPELLCGLEERGDEEDNWATWLNDDGRSIWVVISNDVANALDD